MKKAIITGILVCIGTIIGDAFANYAGLTKMVCETNSATVCFLLNASTPVAIIVLIILLYALFKS